MTSATEVPQHMQALARANAVRQGHAELRRELCARAISLTEAIDDPRASGHLPIGLLLRAVPRYGSIRVQRILRGLRISEKRRVDQLTERQRRLILAKVSGG